MKKIVGFGDFLVRLSPPGYQRFLQAECFEINYTGAEANVLVSLSLMVTVPLRSPSRVS